MLKYSAGPLVVGVLQLTRFTESKSSKDKRFDDLPSHFKPQLAKPHEPYPQWDTNWDWSKPSSPREAALLPPSASADEVKNKIRELYAEEGTGNKPVAKVEELIEKAEAKEGGIDRLLWRALRATRGVQRHYIFVRHGQYEQGPREGGGSRPDEEKVLTPVGRQQAKLTGLRISQMLHPALTTEGRGIKAVRLRTSTMTRAGETASIIADQLPAGSYELIPPSPLLVEGSPPVHNLPSGQLYTGRQVHASLMEAGFRTLMCRLPIAAAKPSAIVKGAEKSNLTGVMEQQQDSLTQPADDAEGTMLQKPLSPPPRDEYEIVVCHANVIRYMTLRALQLPPEAWFRFHPKNCSITHLRVTPDGEVDLFTFGDDGHLSIDQSTFNMHTRYPFK